MSPSWGRLQGTIGGLLLLRWGRALQRGWVVSTDYRTLIDALAALRHELGVSQRELARRVGKPPSFVNKIELFERRLDVLEFIVIAEALGRDPGKLLAALRVNLDQSIVL